MRQKFLHKDKSVGTWPNALYASFGCPIAKTLQGQICKGCLAHFAKKDDIKHKNFLQTKHGRMRDIQ
jgi:hypothetical protein